MHGTRHPLAERLRLLAQDGPIVVAHRGDSRNHPENTLPAFAAAVQLGAPVQEFDVQASRDGVLVCIHDESLDRTTDAATALGPGGLVAQSDAARLQQLDAGSWKGAAHAGARIPTLAQALAAMLPRSVPMIEQKAGAAGLYAALLQQLQVVDQVLLQSFDWRFLRDARNLLRTVPIGLLGPGAGADRIDAQVLDAARELDACFVHWHAPEVTADAVAAVHSAGMLLVTYTSDTELAWCGGARLGFDAMCTNDPSSMLAARERGLLRRG
jgi:glycerophosphoryl diester phosphodiesterase